MMWPDRGYAPFRSEKGGTAASAYQYSFAGPDIPAGRVDNGVQSHEDLFVTPAAAAGLPDIKEK
jgi:arylsulfatase